MPSKSKKKKKKPKLLPHETELLASGHLVDVTHTNASAIWLHAPSLVLDSEDSDAEGEKRESGTIASALVYRHMGDEECAYLLTHGQLPDTQPYQTIVEGSVGRTYCEGYLRGLRKPSGNIITTVVEFKSTRSLVDTLFAMQRKIEDGCFSHGLGDKGGKGLTLFNHSLSSGETTYRIVLVKRT